MSITAEQRAAELVRVERDSAISDEHPWMCVLQNDAQGESMHFATREEAEALAGAARKMVRDAIVAAEIRALRSAEAIANACERRENGDRARDVATALRAMTDGR